MRIANGVGGQAVAFLLLLLMLGTPHMTLAMAAQQEPEALPSTAESVPAKTEAAAQPESPQTQQLPDSPGTTRSSQPPTSQPPAGTQTPAGTAAAEVSNAGGVAASKPAGVAIAPAKQRRVRSFLIKMGAIVGAGVAVGTVVALSQGSPSRPPGAR